MRKMAVLLVVVFGLLVTCHARADNYRVPLPFANQSHVVVDGYTLMYTRFDARSSAIKTVDRVPHTPIYRTAAQCSRAQAGRLSRPDAQGYVKSYWCHVMLHIVYPKGTGVL